MVDEKTTITMEGGDADYYGVLIFKWNDSSKKRKEVLEVLGREPLFGHPNGSKIPTHWFCFMKFPEYEKEGRAK